MAYCKTTIEKMHQSGRAERPILKDSKLLAVQREFLGIEF